MKLQLHDNLDAIIIFTITFIIYCLQLPPGITFEDAGYFLSASLEGGYAHPPGYPLYTILLKIWVNIGLLFSKNAAFLGSLLSVLLTSLSLAFLYVFLKKHLFSDAQRLSIQSRSLLVVVCLLMGVSFELMEQTVLIEVYALHLLLLALLYISLIRKSYIITGLLTGLALCNHSTAIYFFPFILLWLILIDGLKINVIVLSGVKKFIPGLLLGLLPYLYLPFVAKENHPLQWGSASTWAGFKEIVFRTNYWKNPASDISLQFKQLKVAGLHFLDQWGFIIPLLFLATLTVYFVLKNKDKKLIYWHLCWFIQLPVMAILANMSTEGEGQKLVSVFFIPGYLFALISIVVSYKLVLEKYKNNMKLNYAFMGLLGCTLIYSLAVNFKTTSMQNYTTPQLFVEQTKEMVADKKSIILTWNDFSFTPLIYNKYTLNEFESTIPIPHSFFKDINLLSKYEKMYNLELSPLKEATIKFLKTRQQGHIGTLNDKDFYDALTKSIKVWLNQGYKVFIEYKLNNDLSKSLYFDPKGSFFEVLLSKPLLEKKFHFLNQEKPNYSLGNNDIWHKQFYAKYSEHLILKALLNRSSTNLSKYLNSASIFSIGTKAETKVHEGIKKHFPQFKLEPRK